MLAGANGRAAELGDILQNIVVNLANLIHTVGLLDGGGVRFALAAEGLTAQHTAAGQEDTRNIQPCSCHQHARNGFVAGTDEHEAVQPVCPCHGLNAVCHKLAGWQRVAGTAVGGADTVAHGNTAELYRRAACAVNTVFHLFGQFLQMAVSGNNVREGIADTDDGTGHVIVGEAVCLVKGAAGDETVREKCTGFKFLLHMNTS